MTTSQVAPRWLRRQLNRASRYGDAATPDQRLWAAYDWFRSVVNQQGDASGWKDEVAAYLAGRAAALGGYAATLTAVRDDAPEGHS
jgi:hypothetical protein